MGKGAKSQFSFPEQWELLVMEHFPACQSLEFASLQIFTCLFLLSLSLTQIISVLRIFLSETNFMPSIHNCIFYLNINDLSRSQITSGTQIHVYYNSLVSHFLARSS